MNIRLAQETDWEVYKQLESGFREIEPDDFYLFRKVAKEGRGRYGEGYRRCRIFLAEIRGRVVGMGGVSFTEDKGYLEGGIILPSYRSYGFYRPLLDHRMTFLESMGVSTVEISTANPRVRKVIYSLGFEKVSDLDYVKRLSVL